MVGNKQRLKIHQNDYRFAVGFFSRYIRVALFRFPVLVKFQVTAYNIEVLHGQRMEGMKHCSYSRVVLLAE